MRDQIVKSIENYMPYCQMHKHAVRIYAEGDSWFDYLGSDILTEVYDQATIKPVILKRSSAGDEAGQMLSGDQRHQLVRDLSTLKQHDMNEHRFNAAPDVILFSAGGNDIVGMFDFPLFIRKAPDGSPISDFINSAHLELRLLQIALSYIEMGYMRDRYFPRAPIVTHQYGRVIPSTRGLEILDIKVMKSWMKPYMDTLQIAFDDQQKIVDYILGRHVEQVGQLQQGTYQLNGQAVRIGNLHIAPTHGVVNGDEWANEIHPTPAGFEKVGKVVLDTIRQSSADLAGRI